MNTAGSEITEVLNSDTQSNLEVKKEQLQLQLELEEEKAEINLPQKVIKDVVLNESTDGFITQINVEEKRKSPKMSESIKSNSLILNSEPDSAKAKTSSRTKSKKELSFDLSPSFISPSKKTLESHEMTINENPTDIEIKNDISGFFSNITREPKVKSATETTLPSIESEKNKFPNRRNFFNRRIYIKYLTNKIEKENEYLSMLRSNTQSRSSKSAYKPARLNKLNYSANTATSNSTKYEKQVFLDLKKVTSPPPSRLGKNGLKNQNEKTEFLSERKLNSSFNKILKKKASTTAEENKPKAATSSSSGLKYTPSTRAQDAQTPGMKNVVDLNILSDNSRLASHYLFQSARHLSELNLYDLWPKSKMCKVTIKNNPWVNTFKARSFAHEVNNNFRNYNASKYEIKSSMFPHIKPVY